MPRSNKNYLLWKFGKGCLAANATLVDENMPVIEPEDGETVIARITVQPSLEPIFLTDTRIIRQGKTLFRYAEIERYFWMDRDFAIASKMKRTHFDQVIVDLRNGQSILLTGLDQAVFPLMSFFGNKVLRDREYLAQSQ